MQPGALRLLLNKHMVHHQLAHTEAIASLLRKHMAATVALAARTAVLALPTAAPALLTAALVLRMALHRPTALAALHTVLHLASREARTAAEAGTSHPRSRAAMEAAVRTQVLLPMAVLLLLARMEAMEATAQLHLNRTRRSSSSINSRSAPQVRRHHLASGVAHHAVALLDLSVAVEVEAAVLGASISFRLDFSLSLCPTPAP